MAAAPPRAAPVARPAAAGAGKGRESMTTQAKKCVVLTGGGRSFEEMHRMDRA
jgi:hypothetical protein